MNETFITPISMQSLEGAFFKQQGNSVNSGSTAFSDIFKSAVQNVVSTENDLNNKEYLLATGQIDDAHTVPIATAKAGLAVDLLVALRAKALESYNEIIRLSV